MTEEAPLSSLSIQQELARPRESYREGVEALRITRQRWDEIGVPSLTKATLVVVGSWLLLAWNRFGYQGVETPRTVARFVLVGVYGWLGLVAVLWLLGLGLNRIATRPVSRPAIGAPLLSVVGLAHLPLLVFGFVLQLGQLIPVPFAMFLVTVVVFVLWLPAVLVAAVGSVTSRPWSTSAAHVAPAYAIWLVTVGGFLLSWLGHLI